MKPTPSVLSGFDEELDNAIAKITRICDNVEDVPGLLKKQNPDRVNQLSRKTPERPRYEVNRARDGKRILAEKSCAFDTPHFGKVNNRLGRSGGKIRKAVAIVNHLGFAKFTEHHLQSLREMVHELIANSSTLADLVRSMFKQGSSNVPEGTPTRETVWTVWTQSNLVGVVAQNAIGALSHAAGYVRKCCRDLPRVKNLLRKRFFAPTRTQTHSALVRLFMVAKNLLELAKTVGVSANLKPRTQRTADRRIVTHRKPDTDAIVSTWLVETFLCKNKPVDVVFVPYNRCLLVEASADYIVDLGGLHHPEFGLFDHKLPALKDRHDSCAAKLIWEHLKVKRLGVGHLESLINAVYAGDSVKHRGEFQEELRLSNENGLHAQLKKARDRKLDDKQTYQFLKRWLDAKYP